MQTEFKEIGGRKYLVTTGDISSDLGDRPVLAIRELVVRTEYWAKPDPCRKFDWEAWDDLTLDGAPDAGHLAHIVGYGATEAEATADLIAQHLEHDEELHYASRRDMENDERRWARIGAGEKPVL